MRKRKLTDKQLAFCREYVKNGYNATKATENAGYSVNGSQQIGSRLLLNAVIRERVDHHKTHLEELLNISKSRIIKEHMKLAMSSIAHFHNTWVDRKEFESLTDDQRECISEISTSIVKKNIGTIREPEVVYVEYVKIKLYDKQKSLDAISKIMGYDAPLRFEGNLKNEQSDVAQNYPFQPPDE